MAWGAVVDRVGERRVLVIGMAATALASAGAALSSSFAMLGVFLLIGGMAASSANAASGRVVVGWFPPQRRGFAMGIRQMALPLGVAIAALTVPGIAQSHGVGWALALPWRRRRLPRSVACSWSIRPGGAFGRPGFGPVGQPVPQLGCAVADQRRSVLLVVPQYLVWTFALLWLMTDRNWSAASAGLLITVTQCWAPQGGSRPEH